MITSAPKTRYDTVIVHRWYKKNPFQQNHDVLNNNFVSVHDRFNGVQVEICSQLLLKKKQIVRKEEARERSKVGSENRFARTDLSKRVARATKERQARGLQHMFVLVAEKKVFLAFLAWDKFFFLHYHFW